MVILRVRRFGNALGVVLPTEVVARLNTQDGRLLCLTETPDGYRLVAYDPDFESRMAKAEEIMRRYPDTLHVLAR